MDRQDAVLLAVLLAMFFGVLGWLVLDLDSRLDALEALHKQLEVHATVKEDV